MHTPTGAADALTALRVCQSPFSAIKPIGRPSGQTRAEHAKANRRKAYREDAPKGKSTTRAFPDGGICHQHCLGMQAFGPHAFGPQVRGQHMPSQARRKADTPPQARRKADTPSQAPTRREALTGPAGQAATEAAGFSIRNPANALTQTNAPTAAGQNRIALACIPSRPPAMPCSLGPTSRALNAASIPALDKKTAPVSAENKTQSTTHHCHEHVLSTQTPTTVTITADHLYQENVLPTPTHTPITAGHLPPPLTTAGRSPPGHPRPRRGLAGQACTPTQAHTREHCTPNPPGHLQPAALTKLTITILHPSYPLPSFCAAASPSLPCHTPQYDG
jgi:hypothetical protein